MTRQYCHARLRVTIIAALAIGLGSLWAIDPTPARQSAKAISQERTPAVTFTPMSHSPAARSSYGIEAERQSVVEAINQNNNYFLKVDLTDPGVKTHVLLPNSNRGGLQSLSVMKGRMENKGYRDWAIINGDLYSGNCPSGVNCAQGLTVINGQQKGNWSAYGDTWKVRGNIGFGDNNGPDVHVGDHQIKRHMTIGGGPRIVIAGGEPTCNPRYYRGYNKTHFLGSDEWFDTDVSWWCTNTKGITLIGYSQDRRYLYMGVSKGDKTVIELAQWLKDQGAHEILRMDSGSSAGMYHNGTLHGNGSKQIANAFAISVEDVVPTPTPTPLPPNSWKAEFWNNDSLSGKPSKVLYEQTTYLFHDWGSGSPHPDIQDDHFSVRYTKKVKFSDGRYRFHCHHQGGCRLKIDGVTKIDAWWAREGLGGNDDQEDLSAGEHEIVVEYYNWEGDAYLDTWWQGPGYLPLSEDCGDYSEWCAQYYGNKNLKGTYSIRRKEGTTLAHTWDYLGPHATFPSNQFSARFERRLDFTCGTYRFDLFSDDGVRFWIDGALIVDHWVDKISHHTADVHLDGRHELKVKYFESYGGAAILLDWEKLDTKNCFKADDYESDDSMAHAKPLNSNQVHQAHTIHDINDTDWFKFTAKANHRYTMKTFSLGADIDTILYLYDIDGTSTLGWSIASQSTTPGSSIDWIFDRDGLYYLKVEHSGTSLSGADTRYDIQLFETVPTVCLSSTSGGKISNLSFRDEDILCYNLSTTEWHILFDGSTEKLPAKADINAFHILDNGDILMSFDQALTVPGLGKVDDSDIVKYIPAATGRGTWARYFRGRQAQLATGGEDINALFVLPGGDLVISTLGTAYVRGIRGAKRSDMLRFMPTQLGSTTQGSWGRYFIGQREQLRTKGENIWGGSYDEESQQLYMTTRGNFKVNNLQGKNSEIFQCAPTSTTGTPRCVYSAFWKGIDFDLGRENIDGLHLLWEPTVRAAQAEITNNPSEVRVATIIELDEQIYLPFISQ